MQSHFFVCRKFSATTCNVVLSKRVAEVYANATVPKTLPGDGFLWNATPLKSGFVLSKLVRLFTNTQNNEPASGLLGRTKRELSIDIYGVWVIYYECGEKSNKNRFILSF